MDKARGWPVWARMLIAGLLAAGLIIPLVIWHDPIWSAVADREHVVEAVRKAGWWGPLLLIGLIVAQTIVAPIPGQVTNFAAGYLYGLGQGFLVSWAGLALGMALALALARYAGRPLVRRLVGRERLDWLDRLSSGQGLGFFFLVFLIPGLPDDLLCLAAGLTNLPLRSLLAIGCFARVPGLLAAVWLGASAEGLPWQAWAGMTAAALAIGIVTWRYGRQIQEFILSRLRRVQ